MTALAVVEWSSERATLPVGAAAPSFEGLLGTDGQTYGLSTLRDREAIVLIFSSNRCPTIERAGPKAAAAAGFAATMWPRSSMANSAVGIDSKIDASRR